jgi:hypothetical protein
MGNGPQKIGTTTETTTIPSLPPLPRNFAQIKSTIITGANAFLPKLPRPLIRQVRQRELQHEEHWG